MNYEIIVPKPVQKQLKQLKPTIYPKIIEKISRLADEPRPVGAKKLTGMESEYRIRIGNYRVRYEIDDKAQLIVILSCRHRRDAYKHK